MATPILLPKQGNTVETCLIVGWKKQSGEAVKKGEILCEVETDKAVFEVTSPADGILLATFVGEGDDVPVLTTIAVVGEAGEPVDGFRQAAAPHGPTLAGDDEGTVKPASPVAGNEEHRRAAPSAVERGVSPRARKALETTGLSADMIEAGTGPGGRIVERDVRAAARAYPPLTQAAKSAPGGTVRPDQGSGIGGRITREDLRTSGNAGEIEKTPLRGVRKIIADRMLSSLRDSAQLTLHASARADALVQARQRFKSGSPEEFRPVTINDLVHFAVVRALAEHPPLNSLLVDETIEVHRSVHLGFAVDTPRGLLVPVIRNAQSRGLSGLHAEAARLAEACRTGRVDPAELAGGTFTVTNLGGLGIESFTPVLNLPQSAILGVNAIADRPVNTGRGIDLVPFISFSLTIDHRVIDGAAGARFLQSLGAAIARIESLVLAHQGG
jgi:pyruvate dehydrogenase E2 component (dihydrolipoamide acetyltransferase)